MPISITDIKFDPNPLIIGKIVVATCKVFSDEEIESVKVYDPKGEVLIMTHEGGGRYKLEELVPYDADLGTYYATIVVTDKKGKTEKKDIEVVVG
jgi:hypothetical protein